MFDCLDYGRVYCKFMSQRVVMLGLQRGFPDHSLTLIGLFILAQHSYWSINTGRLDENMNVTNNRI